MDKVLVIFAFFYFVLALGAAIAANTRQKNTLADWAWDAAFVGAFPAVVLWFHS